MRQEVRPEFGREFVIRPWGQENWQRIQSLCQHTCQGRVCIGDPEGIRDCGIDFPVDVPLPWARWPKHRVGRYLHRITRAVPAEGWQELVDRARAGDSLRTLARAYGVSYESVRRALKKADL